MKKVQAFKQNILIKKKKQQKEHKISLHRNKYLRQQHHKQKYKQTKELIRANPTSDTICHHERASDQ